MWRAYFGLLFSVLLLLATAHAATEQEEESPEENEGAEQGGEQAGNPSLAEEYLDFIQGGGGEGGAEAEGEEGGEDDQAGASQALTGYTADYLLKGFKKGFSSLSDDDAMTKMVDIAKKFDTNGDGSIDQEELAAWMADEAEKGAAVEDADDLGWKQIDKNEDGKVTLTEILEDLDAPGQRMQAKVTEDEKEQEKMKFEAADKDKDGFLDKDEFRRYSQPEFFRSMNDYLIRATLFDFDKDKDGKISEDEYSAPSTDDKQDPDSATGERFRDLDQDKDGVLSGKEVETLGHDYTLDAVSAHEAGHLLKNADKNGDGKLSMDEISKGFALFTRGMEQPGMSDGQEQEGDGQEEVQEGDGQEGDGQEGDGQEGDGQEGDGQEEGQDEEGGREGEPTPDDGDDSEETGQETDDEGDDKVAGQGKGKDEL